jgi:hypothetical protein
MGKERKLDEEERKREGRRRGEIVLGLLYPRWRAVSDQRSSM